MDQNGGNDSKCRCVRRLTSLGFFKKTTSYGIEIYIYSTYPSLSYTHLWFHCSNVLTHPRQILLVELQTTGPQLMWPPHCSKLSSLWRFFEVREEAVDRRGQIRRVGRVFQNFKVKVCQFLVRSGHLVRNRTVWKKQNSFRKLAPMFGDQLQIPFVEKCKSVLCCESCAPF
jgi:hypothetical protein